MIMEFGIGVDRRVTDASRGNRKVMLGICIADMAPIHEPIATRTVASSIADIGNF